MTEPCLHTVAKKCYECGTEWQGYAFTAQPAGAPPLPGMCADCGAKEDARVAALARPVLDTTPKDVELVPPRAVREFEDDVIPIDRKRLASGDTDE